MADFNPLKQVAEFHDAFEHPNLVNPEIPDDKRCKLRYDLLHEELKELEEAIAQKDLRGIADALCDLQYVLSGAVLEFGLGTRFPALFNEVHRSNMSKACNTEEEATLTGNFYFEKDGTIAFHEERDGKFFVLRHPDRKILKSINYSPANLDPFLL